MEETKEERRLLNHQRYLEMWDRHEGAIQNHFASKERRLYNMGNNDNKLEINQRMLKI